MPTLPNTNRKNPQTQLWLHTHDGQQEFDFNDIKVKEVYDTERFLSNIDNVLINGTQLLLNPYSLFNGSQYEGFTMIPMIDDFKQRFTLGDDFVVVADSDLMNKNNVTLLQKAGYKYVLGARIRSESAGVRQWILSLKKTDKACYNYRRENGERLIVSYSDKRAKKDAYNRDRGIARLRKAYKSGRITKNQVNRRGYNKFLEISKDIEVVISEEKRDSLPSTRLG